MRRKRPRVWLLLGVLALACKQDAALPQYDACKRAEHHGYLDIARGACESAMRADPGTPSGVAAERLLKRIDAQLVERENAIPAKVTEAWCDRFANRFYERALAGLTAEESQKKYSQRKTKAYLEQIVSDDAAFKRVHCKDQAGEPPGEYYVCMHRSDFSGYAKCKDDEKKREHARIAAEQAPIMPPQANVQQGSGGTSQVAALEPTAEEWLAVGEVSVRGSSALSCETKVLDGFFRARCGANDLGRPVAVSFLTEAPRGHTAEMKENSLLLIHPFEEGVTFQAGFAWEKGSRVLSVTWPPGATRPQQVGAFSGAVGQ